jgi:hypothetical protein
VIIPLVVSLRAVLELRDLRCTGGFSYTFAPLLVTCGDRTLPILVTGWALTIATVAGLVVAALATSIGFISARNTQERMSAWSLALAVAGVLITTGAVLASNPDSIWGINSWIFFSAAGSSIVIGLVAIGSRIARNAKSRNTPV